MRSHRRLEERLDELQMASGGADTPAAADIARDVAAFFARAVRRHEEDEEQSLFPRLGKVASLAPSLERLAREHREHEKLHAELDALAEKLAGGEDALRELGRVADALTQAYRTHIEEEENVLFPAARAALDDSGKAEIVREMQARRGDGGGGGRRRRS